MRIKDIILEDEKPQVRPKLSMRELDVKAKEELTDKIFTYPGGPRQTEYFNIPFTATIQQAKTEYFKSNQVSVGNAVDKAVKYYQDNPDKAEVEVNKERSFASAGGNNQGGNKQGAPLGNQNARKRGAQLGNQNARKYAPGGGIGAVQNAIKKGIDTAKFAYNFKAGDTLDAIGRGQDIAGELGNKFADLTKPTGKNRSITV